MAAVISGLAQGLGGGTPGAQSVGRKLYGTDGKPLQEGAAVGEDGMPIWDEGPVHHGIEIHDRGWFQAETNRAEQAQLARTHLDAICAACVEQQMRGKCPDARWINDPESFPDLNLRGSLTANACIPFVPHDQQFYICGTYDPEFSKLRTNALPGNNPDDDGNSSWVRIVDFADHSDACHLFDDFTPEATTCGRIYQGSLDNGYFVEALQAVAMRPKLARELFYCWNTRHSIYIARLFKHGTWMRVEVDDYVPVGRPLKNRRVMNEENAPIGCRSEHFPFIMWPTLIEKAYAKLHTLRGSTSESTPLDRGGWEALAGGGHVEEALGDLTGGVAGRFETCDLAPDRLFVYLYELQRDTLFVCRPNQKMCETYDVPLNPYYPNVVNRAVHFEGRLFIQCFCGAPGIFDGGLQDISVPYALINHEDYPERSAQGFFWLSASDFCAYFGTIFECRLVNSGDVSIKGMPAPRMPGNMPAFQYGPGMQMPPGMPPVPGMPMPPAGMPFPGMPGAPGPMPAPGAADPRLHMTSAEGGMMPWYEWVYANPGEVTEHNLPEFSIRVPEHQVPCEIICSVEQMDPRMTMTTPVRPEPEAILVKVYENVEGSKYYSKELVCRSNWINVRDSMVAMWVRKGCELKVIAEFPSQKSKVERMIIRCYSSRPNVQVSAGVSWARHMLVEPIEAPRAIKWTLVGAQRDPDLPTDRPEPLDPELDSLRLPEFDANMGLADLKSELSKDCSLM